MNALLFFAAACGSSPTNQICTASLPQSPTNAGEIQNVLGIVFGVIGALALLFIVISGFRYIVSGGDPQSTAKAKEGIIYALVGLVLAIFAEVIVTFVVGRIS